MKKLFLFLTTLEAGFLLFGGLISGLGWLALLSFLYMRIFEKGGAAMYGFGDHGGAGGTSSARQSGCVALLSRNERASSRRFRVGCRYRGRELKELIGCNNPAVLASVDTVGAVALDKRGIFALASSTGGSGLTRRGRGGDVSARGAGCWDSFKLSHAFALYSGGRGVAPLTQIKVSVASRQRPFSFDITHPYSMKE